MLHSIWKSAVSCSIASFLIGLSSPRSSATSWSPVVSPTRPSRPFQRLRRNKIYSIDMLSGRSSCGTKSKIYRISKVISYSLMSVYSRLEATRKVLGQINELMWCLKIVQASSLVKPFAQQFANAMDSWILKSQISHSPKKNLSHFSEIWELRYKGMTPFISLWTTAKSILSMTKWISLT